MFILKIMFPCKHNIFFYLSNLNYSYQVQIVTTEYRFPIYVCWSINLLFTDTEITTSKQVTREK